MSITTSTTSQSIRSVGNDKPMACSYTWVFDNFAASTSSYFYYVSPRFSPPGSPGIQFKLFHYSKNSEDRTAYCTTDQSLIVLSASYDRFDLVPNRDELTVRFLISLIDANGVKRNTSECITKFIRQELITNGQYSISRPYLLEPSNGLLLDDKLLIYCEVEILNDGKDALCGSQKPLKNIASEIMSTHYGSLLESGKFSDVTLLVGEAAEPFKAHKSILSARSKVFATMFDHTNTKEVLENRVTIPDLKADVCQHFLAYIYTGKIDSLERYALELLIAADKYQLDYLKDQCEEYLMSSVLSTESVASLLLHSDMYQAQHLKQKCLDYITDRVMEVMATDGWQELLQHRIELTVELLEQLAIKTSGVPGAKGSNGVYY